ncbi:MAG: ABC transporter ATP-binding protein [Deltaproteobacteria bacterium]|nr:ABC transporter ATP-binding protein [Deltaproteobacteria bacterium]
MLRVEQVTKRFGGLMAVNDVSFEIDDEGITGLIGPNGSGKSTLFHLITGFYQLDKGKIVFNGREVGGLAPHCISRAGLIRTFQQTRVLPSMTTLDNLLAAVPDQAGEQVTSLFLRPGSVRREERENSRRAEEILKLITLSHMQNELAGRLSFGQQKLVELGRVLMARPRMILLDEPTAGINPTLVSALSHIIKDLASRGIQVFLIEHNMPFVTRLCRRIYVMDSGSLIFSGTPGQVRKNEQVIEAYLGRTVHA